MPVEWMHRLVKSIADALGPDADSFVVRGAVAIVLVCPACGMVGALIVGNRMAFFSEVMAHCAFAGVSLGYLSAILAGAGHDEALIDQLVPFVMFAVAAAVGLGVGYVRENTSLTNDTVIGVMFALAVGSGSMLFTVLKEYSTFNPEAFLFGSPLFVPDVYLVYLVGLLLAVTVFLLWRYNALVFAAYGPSLARTRRVRVRLDHYLFVVLLALVVNLSIKVVGALLISGLLVVPAATAVRFARNLRQMFWYTVGVSLLSGLVGLWLSVAVTVPIRGRPVAFGTSGVIVVVGVTLFFAAWAGSLVFGRRAGPAGPR